LRNHGDGRAVADRERHIAEKLSAVAAALNDEPVSPADPLVMLLLDTADEAGLMRLYRSTHSDRDE
jgi:hypothetical protein